MKKVKIQNLLICSILFLFALWKTTIGIHSDEVHSIAVGDMIASGCSYFKECWFYLQMSAVFTSPLIWIYKSIFGTTDGIILFFRVMAVIVQALLAMFFYGTFSKDYGKRNTFIAALLFFVYVPDFQSFNYKQEIIWFSLLQIIFLYRYYRNGKKFELIGIALAISAGVLAYPTTVIQFLLCVAMIAYIDNKRTESKAQAFKAVALVGVMCALCAGLFLAYVLRNISIEEFLHYFFNVFKDDNLDTSFVTKMLHPIKKYIFLGAMTYIPIIICMKAKCMNRIAKRYQLPIMEILICGAFGLQVFIERKGVTWHCITYAYSVCLFLLFLFCKDMLGKRTIFFFGIPALVIAFCMALASNQGNITCMYGTIFSAMGLVLIIGKSEPAILGKECIKPIRTMLSLLVCAFLVFVLLVYEQETVLGYPTCTVFAKRQLADSGPAKGIKLGEHMFTGYKALCMEVEKNVGEKDYLLIIDDHEMTSFGYLNSKGEYATFSPQGGWGISTSDKIVTYFEEMPYRVPTVIIVNKNYIDMKIDDYFITTPLGKYMEDNLYEICEENEQYVVLRK